MTSFQSQPANVEAEQWDGSEESLKKIQQLIFPASPLLGRKENAASADNMHLGIMADNNDGFLKQQLVHAMVGDWVVKYPSGQIKVMKEKEFAELFVPVRAADLAANSTDRPSLADA